MQLSPQQQPLTRLNVTKHDRIWKKETSDGFYGFNINKNSLFSPPLKHITPEVVEELWDRYDPLDLLIDSGSDKSSSSGASMIMMTTEEERKNEESIKNSFLAFERQKNIKNSSLSYSQDFGNHGNYELTSTECQSGRGSDYDVNVDEGYGTDSRTNTTASLSSPLSSSLSSLLTSESSSSQGSLKRGVSQSMNSNSKSQQIQGNGRLVIGNKPNVVVKKKPQPVEKNDNSLIERLRALTTIEEEETLTPANVEQEWNNVRKSVPNPKCSNDQGFNSVQEGSNCSGNVRPVYVREGVFRAKPVQVAMDTESSRLLDNRMANGRNISCNDLTHSDGNFYNDPNYSVGNTIDSETRKRGILRNGSRLQNSQRFFPQDSQSTEEIHQRPSHMTSMPNINASVARTGNPFENGVDTSQVRMRPKSSNVGSSPWRSHRYSWDYCDVNSVKGKFSDTDNQNLSDRIPEPPKLTNQIRASSEMSLKSGRPLFATSSDIYRLFQGQGHSSGLSQPKSSHRHSFHAIPSQSWQPNVSVSEVKSRLRGASCGTQANRSNGPVPVKANHDIYNHVAESYLPWETTGSGKSADQIKHRSLSGEKEKLSTLV